MFYINLWNIFFTLDIKFSDWVRAYIRIVIVKDVCDVSVYSLGDSCIVFLYVIFKCFWPCSREQCNIFGWLRPLLNLYCSIGERDGSTDY